MTDTSTIIIFILLFIILGNYSSVSSLKKKLSQANSKLNSLQRDSLPDIEFDPYENLTKDIIHALESGYKIRAVQWICESTDKDLKDAKKIIDDIGNKGLKKFSEVREYLKSVGLE